MIRLESWKRSVSIVFACPGSSIINCASAPPRIELPPSHHSLLASSDSRLTPRVLVSSHSFGSLPYPLNQCASSPALQLQVLLWPLSQQCLDLFSCGDFLTCSSTRSDPPTAGDQPFTTDRVSWRAALFRSVVGRRPTAPPDNHGALLCRIVYRKTGSFFPLQQLSLRLTTVI
jgi:hypothetical protein